MAGSTALAKYIVSLEADTAKYQKGMEKADKRLKTFQKSQTRGLNRIKGEFVKLAAGILSVGVAVQGVRKLVNIARETDILNAQLVTATGSAEGAAFAFEKLEAFAARTPFALEQTVNGFVKLVNLGLTPSERALESYGNTASAMGKSLSQFIEAVADAATSEFERLKEFGIKAKNQGDTIAFTFRGVTTTVQNNAKAIEGFLIELGETDFAGAMVERSKTLDGALSNLGDSWDGLFRTIAASDIGGAMEAATRSAITGIDALSDALEIYLEKSDEAATNTSAVGAAISWLGSVGITVSATFEKLGNVIGAAGAAVALTLKGDVDGLLSVVILLEEKQRAIDERAKAALARLGGRAPPKISPTVTVGGVDQSRRLEDFAKGGEGSGFDPTKRLEKELAFLIKIEDARIKAFDRVIESLRTEEEAIQASYDKRLAIILANTEAGSAAQEELTERLKKQTQDQLDALNSMNQFAQQAAQNMQTAFAEFLFDPFDKGVKGMLKGFVDALRRMVAEFLAQKILSTVFGAIGGPFGKASGVGGVATRAGGGPVNAGQLVQTHGLGDREFFVPSTSGRIQTGSKRGDGGITINAPLTVNGASRSEFAAAAALLEDRITASVFDQMQREGR